MACFETNIVFPLGLVEGKDRPTEGACVSPKFELEIGSKIASFCLRMTKLTWVSGQGCMLDSWFGHIAKVVELRKKGLHTNFFKEEDILA